MTEERLIQVWSPKREWLLRCGGDEPKVCSIEVGQGVIEVWSPEGRDPLRLELSQIAEFREAFDQAVELAELDLRACTNQNREDGPTRAASAGDR